MEDSAGCPRGWELREDAMARKAARVESVGWVMAVRKRSIQVAPHVVVTGSTCVQGHMVIPRSAILGLRVLELRGRQ